MLPVGAGSGGREGDAARRSRRRCGGNNPKRRGRSTVEARRNEGEQCSAGHKTGHVFLCAQGTADQKIAARSHTIQKDDREPADEYKSNQDTNSPSSRRQVNHYCNERIEPEAENEYR